MGVFAEGDDRNYKYRYAGTLHVEEIAGGTPANREVLEWHLRNKAGENVTEGEIVELATAIMEEREVSQQEALGEAVTKYANDRALTWFRRDPEKGLWIPGNNLKACLKEAASIAVNVGRLPGDKFWGVGAYKKQLRAWFPEHVWVAERQLFLGKADGDRIDTSFPEVTIPGKGKSRAIKYTEICENVDIDFTLSCDWEITYEQWEAIWTTAQRVGIGADRAHYGAFDVTRWEPIATSSPKRIRKAA